MARVETMSSTLRAFQVMDLLAQSPYELSLSAIAGELDLAPATAHRVTATLCAAGYVEQESESKRYRLSAAVGGLPSGVFGFAGDGGAGMWIGPPGDDRWRLVVVSAHCGEP